MNGKRVITERQEQAFRLVHHDFAGLSQKEAAKVMGTSEQAVGELLKAVKLVAPHLFPILTKRQFEIKMLILDEGRTREAAATVLGCSVKDIDNVVQQLKQKGFGLIQPKTVQYESFMDDEVKECF